MDLGLRDKVVVVTGGTAGIGRSCVDAFLEEGSRVVVCGRSEGRLEEFRKEYEGRPVLAVRADVSSPEDMEALARAAAEHFGGIDVWVNNAGIYPKGNLEDMPLDMWRETFAVNVDGVLYGSRAAIPYLRKAGGGVIVNASSYASIMPTGGRGAYGVTKAAVSQMTRVMAAELAPDHIRVVAYMPGFVLTGINAAVIGEYDDGAVKRQAVQNRYGRTEEIARLVVFLASDAASFITGCGVEASGGKYCVQNPFAAWEKGELTVRRMSAEDAGQAQDET